MFEFKTAEIPTVTRARKDNPYAGTVKELEKSGKAATVEGISYRSSKAKDAVDSFFIRGYTVNPDDEKSLVTLVQQMQSAGRDANVTVKKVVSQPKDNKVDVTFWVVAAIKRPRGE